MKNNMDKSLLPNRAASNISLQFGLLLLVLLLAAVLNSWGQVVSPVRYWTFNGNDATKDSMNNYNLNFNMYLSQYTIGNNGQVGKHVTLNEQSWLVDGGPVTLNTGLSVEFLMKPGYKFNSTKFLSRGDDVFFIRMEYPKITFYTFHVSGTGAYIMDEFVVDLNGLGRKSYGYYVDGNWHHLVFKINTATGVKEIWVDGQLPAGFSKSLTPGTFTNAGNSNIYLNHNVGYVKYHGSLDEIAIYNTAIPSSLIYKHYLGVQNGQPYSFVNDYTQPIPPAASVTGGIDINEYPAGHPNVTASAISQLNTFPTPRYKPGHTLIPNFNWMDPKYMGGLFQPGVTTSTAVSNSTIIQTELSKNFNYHFNVGAANDAFDLAWVAAANANPNFKLGMTIFRAQLNGNRPDLTSQTKPTDHYLQNANGQYLDPDGNVTTSYKYWRPTAPTSSYTADGNNILGSLNFLFSNLTRGVDIINENGEVFPLYTQTAASKDPAVTAAKNASGLSWENFLGKKFMENETQSYRNIFMSHPKMANGKFTEFAIDGYAQYRYSYSEARKANTPINGQYYSTPDFYPRWPHNWRNWVSAWHGWQWIVETRVNELAVGDNLFSPFVSAGWDSNEEVNMRPAQWLGLLKTLNMAGAEFFYSCYFSLTAPFPDSKNWVWQAVVPSYAQAVASRYEDYMRNGTLMAGDVANSYINPTGPGYSFWAGDPRKLVVARKHNTGTRYAITGTLQPNSNIIDATENEGTATVTIDGNQLSFKVRRQGSTYIYDKTTYSDPVFYQIDRWHEKTHPTRWSKDFDFDAELFDNNNTQAVLKTVVPAGSAPGDYTNHTTYVTWPDNATTPVAVEYNFTPRSGANNELYLWVRARSRGGVATSMNVKIDNGSDRTIGCISDTAWTWYRYDACTQQAINYSGLSLQNHKLIITPGNPKLEIDRILLTTEVSMILNPAPATCGSGTATITAGGSTNFCHGGSVTLTASTGSSYLWSPGGQTTQSITVNATGAYSVNVSSGSGCAASATPVNVSVVSAPVATITAGGPTTFCSGGSVTLNASSGSSYLWLPGGQTTQSINVTTSGNYTVRVTNSTGCSATSAATPVTVGSAATATITAGGPTSFCNGGSVTLTANSGSSYLWTPGGQTTQSINATTAGTYTVRVTNSSGCSKISLPITVNVSAVPTASIAPMGPTTFCTGGSVTLVSNAGSSYLWSPGGQTTQSINVNASGNYSVRVTNSSGCSATSSITPVNVVAPPSATISANGPLSFCQGGSVTLTASPGSSYQWMPGGQTTQSITTSSAGSYSVKVFNSTGCSATSAATNVSITTSPAATITANGNTALCPGQTVTLTASNGSSYLWSNGEITQSIETGNAGNYSVIVYSGSGCSASAPAQSVTMLPSVNATITPSGATTFQQGQSVVLTAGGGTSYVWIPNGETTSAITVNSSGIYKVTAFNASGCSATSAPLNINVIPVTAPPATITSTGNGALCPGDQVTLTASSGSAFTWSNGASTQSITVNSAGNYTVTVTDLTGTTFSTASIQVSTNPVPGIPVITSAYIPSSTYQLSAFEPTAHNYKWSTGTTANSIMVSATGTYTVKAINSVGCKSASATIQVSSLQPQPCATANMLSQQMISGTSVKLSWNPAVTADSFRVVCTRTSNGAVTQKNVAGNVSNVIFDNLIQGATYNWNVITICNSGQQASAVNQFTTLSNPLPCGSIPQDLVTESVNSTFAKVSWYDTQADVFILRYREVGTQVYNYRRATNTLTDGMIMGLNPGTTYEWSVRAKCDNIMSLFSPSEIFTTLAACPSIGTVTYSELDFDKVKLYWNASVNTDSIIIRFAVSGTADFRSAKIPGTPNPGYYILNGLTPLTNYDVWVRTKCSTGSTSLWGDPINFTTLAAPSLRNSEESGPIQLNAYPNPTRDNIRYVFNSKDDMPYTVKVCDMAGKELFSEVRVANEGMHGEKISLGGFASGLYMLIVQQGPASGRFKFNLQE